MSIEEPTYAETVAKRYLNEEVEIFMGNTLGSQLYTDYESSDNAIVDGIIRGAEGETLIIDCVFKLGDGSSRTVEVLLHGWAVEAVMRRSEGVPLMAVINMPERKKQTKMRKDSSAK